MPCSGSNPSKISHYSQDKSPNMARKTFMILLSVHVSPYISPFPTSFKLNCFQFFQHVMKSLNSRFLHMILPLCGTLLPTPNTHIHRHTHGQFVLVTRETILSVLLNISIQCLLHCCPYSSPCEMSRQTNA